MKPDLPAAETVRQIMENLVQVMHLNLPGIHQDIDSEFLHDFRVSVCLCRSRSLLGQLKGVLDADKTVILQQKLKAMKFLSTVKDSDYDYVRSMCTYGTYSIHLSKVFHNLFFGFCGN